MKLMKKLLIFILVIGVMLMGGGCERNIFGFKKGLLKTKSHRSETKKETVYKEREEVEEDVRTYMREKYEKEFMIDYFDVIDYSDSVYKVFIYAVDDENKTFCTVTITYIDEENYRVSENYFMCFISDELEKWLKELADPYIDCDFKVFWQTGLTQLSSDYDKCKTAEDFLKLSPTAKYYGLRFLIVLPSQAADTNIEAITNAITAKMLEKRIRGQVTTVVYLDEIVYDLIDLKKDERYFWTHGYKNIFYTSKINEDFSISSTEILDGGDWRLDDETYYKKFEELLKGNYNGKVNG